LASLLFIFFGFGLKTKRPQEISCGLAISLRSPDLDCPVWN